MKLIQLAALYAAKLARPDRRSSNRQTTILLLVITNLLVTANLWAALVAPSQVTAPSVCSNSVTLNWVDANPVGSGEASIQVLRSTRSPSKGYSTIVTLPAFSTSYTDVTVVPAKTYYYKISAVNASGRKTSSAALTVVTPSPLSATPLDLTDVPDTGGNSYRVAVAAGTKCQWVTTSSDSWITITSGTDGMGTGDVTYAVAENPDAGSRTGTVFVANQAVKVTQGGKSCAYTLSTNAASFAATSGSGSFGIVAANGCKWTVTTGTAWITLGTTSGTGNGTVNYTVAANTGVPRSGTINVLDANNGVAATYTVSQTGYYSVAVSASPSAGGSLTGGGSYLVGATATVSATPNACYNFVNWTDGGVVVSTSASYSFTVTGARTLVANFTQPSYTITTSSSPSGGGTTSGGGVKVCGTSVTVTATPNTGYNFVNWTEGGVSVSTSASYTFTASASRTLVANFVAINYNISASASPVAGGTTSGGGTYAYGSTATVNASASACYSFVNWTDGGVVVSTSASYSFTVTGARTLVANFAQASYTITTSAAPSAGGTTSGGGAKTCGASVTVVATPSTGYNFVNWTEGGVSVSTSASYTFTASASRTLVANFALINYNVGASASPVAGGTVTGSGSYGYGTTATVSATPNACYNFVNWTDGGTVVSTSASYSFTVTGARSLVANFTQPSYTITTSASPSVGGTTSGGGAKVCGTSVTVTATPSAGYNFVNWTEGGVSVSGSASYTFTASASRTLVANFTQVATYAITTSSSPTAGGTTGGGGNYTNGTLVTVAATPNACYSFVNWTDGGVVVSTSASYSFTVAGARTLVANFTQPSYTIATSAAPTAGGTTSGGGSKVCGSSVTVTATANSCYNFVNWTEGGVVVSTSASYTFTAAGNRTLVANFSQPSYTIATSAAPTAGGTTSGGGAKVCGSSVTVTATANAGYAFVNWTEGATVVSTSASYTFTASAGRTLVANFNAVCTAPTATTTAASGITMTTAILNGSANPNGCATTAYFQYGLTTSYGSTTASQSLGSGTTVTTTAGSIGSLTAGTLYHYRLVTSNSGGPTYGADMTFTTTANTGLAVTLVSPPNGGTISGLTNLTAVVSASDATVTNVAFFCDVFVTNLTVSPYTFTWNSATESDGAAGIFAIAYDSLGRVTTSAVNSVTITNPPGLFKWSWDFGGTNSTANAAVNAVRTDRQGNVIVTGAFSGSVDFGGGMLASAGGQDIFVAKYTAAGAHVWSRRFGGAVNDDLAYGLAVDASNNVIVAGTFMSSSLDFGTGALSNAGNQDSFVAKFNSSGTCTWAKSFGSTSSDRAMAVAVDGTDSIFVTGLFNSTVNFGAVTLTASTPSCFVVKYQPNGTNVWAKSMASSVIALGQCVAADNAGNVIVGGYYRSNINCGSRSLTNSGTAYDMFVAKCSTATGSNTWAQNAVATGQAEAKDIAVDASNNFVVCGFLAGSGNFGGGAVASPSTVGAVTVVRYLANNTLSWSKVIGGNGISSSDYAKGVATDVNGNVIVTGSVLGAADFGGGWTFGNGAFNIFVSKYTSAGVFRWAKRFSAGTGVSNVGQSCATDSASNIFVGGYFSGTLDLGGGALVTPMSAQDGFLVKYGP